jgi:hypothetical protein
LKKVLVAALILMLCGLMLLVAIAKGGNPTYSMTEYQWIAGATIDGAWTTADEWNDGPPMAMTNNAMFTYNFDSTSRTAQWVIEFFGDTTNDADDYVEICIDPENNGGGANQASDRMIQVWGSGVVSVFEGPTSWISDLGQGELVVAQSISASTWESTPHRIVEISDPNQETGVLAMGAPPTGMGVIAFDATTQVRAYWPETIVIANDNRNPDSWGVIANSSSEPIPEGFSLTFVAVLSSVAVAVSVYFLRKRPKQKTPP